MLPTLMPNWQTLKSLLRAYAQADGQVLFRETTPMVATQAAAPYVNAATQTMGDVVAPAWDAVQDLAATAVGAGRFVSFSLTGLVDFFGPIAEETPSEALQRMTKTLLNGSFALTTRAAKIMTDGVSGNSRYERGVAATEFGLSVLAIWGAVENLVARPPLASFKPISVMHEFAIAGAARTHVPAAGVVIEFPKPPPHILMMAGRPRVDVEKLADALEGCDGNQSAAAEKTGYGVSTVNRYVKQAPEGSRLAKFQDGPRAKNYPKTQKPRGDYDRLLRVLKQCGQNLHRAAKKLDTSVENLSQQLQRAKEQGVKEAQEITLKNGRPETFSDEAMVAAMEAADYNRKEAARILDVKWSTVCRRWKLYNITDGKIWIAIQESDFNIYVAAKKFKIHPNDIRARIRKPGSLLSYVVKIIENGELSPKQKPR